MLCPAIDTIRLVGSTINCYTTKTATIIPCHRFNLYPMMVSVGWQQKLFPCMCRDNTRTNLEVGLPHVSSNSW